MLTATAPGTIEPQVLYTLDEAQQRLRWGKHALKMARTRGLKIIRSGSRLYLLGSDVIAFLQSQRESVA